ncbi:hypothetical protein [Rufibacter roseus]|uniref:DUF4412 domain-containing protein n=1 Tax=Rufibacter roseus TaxID=1567108 RepID=A0ABW2DUT8_9BACT|nr:hypothetical protein [Rufibacter roseus]
MKVPKGCLIPIVVLEVLFGALYISGLNTEYYYAELSSGKENLVLVNDENFKLTFALSIDKDTESSKAGLILAGFTLTSVNNDVRIDTAEIMTFNSIGEPLELDSVYAIDGFYSWKEEMNYKSKSFPLLPDKFKTVSKSIEAYFVYSWRFKINKIHVDTVQVKVNTTVKSKNRTYRIEETYPFELKSRIYFRSPIRAH